MSDAIVTERSRLWRAESTPCRHTNHLATVLGVALLVAPAFARAEVPEAFDAARAFGARESLRDLSLSPDGMRVAYIAPTKGQGTVLFTAPADGGSKATPALALDGHPFRLEGCRWVSNQRLVCQVYGIIRESRNVAEPLPISRWIAVNADASNVQTLATRRNENSRGYFLNDGDIIDYLPDEDGAVLMSRVYTPDARLGTRVGSDEEGLGVDWVDTRSLKVKNIISPRKDAFVYFSDGRGTVRVMGLVEPAPSGVDSAVTSYYYRASGTTSWRKLSQYDDVAMTGFRPLAVDHDLNVAYGFRRSDGRDCLYTIRLDDSLEEHLVYSRPDVDVGGLLEIGRRRHVVGATYVTDRAQREVFEPEIKRLLASLSRALPQQPLIGVTDSSADESRLVIFAGSDSDPGVYYLFDRKSNHLTTFDVVRRELEDVKLAKVKPVTYPAGDGVMIPGYLTLPPGQENAHGLPAIVLPHGGPADRDQWSFDWLPQYFAHRGYAVLQPEFRGSTGYGDAWLQHGGFQSWRVAIGDVLSAGGWLVKEGIADPARIGILGWSYGGYAALQSAVVDPTLFKAVVAIAPVTDLAATVEEWRGWSNFGRTKSFVGAGPHVREGSPIEHASAFKAPVLLFHGTLDRNVRYRQSERLADKLKSVGARVELVSFNDLDHQLADSAARAEMLRRSDEFLRTAFEGGTKPH
jgi:dipeptidyl aminopeptidase/acylaminoacyl peptidase